MKSQQEINRSQNQADTIRRQQRRLRELERQVQRAIAYSELKIA